MEAWTAAQSLLPERLAKTLLQHPGAEELRLRLDKPPGIVLGGREHGLAEAAVTRDELHHVLERATGASLHAAGSAIASGFVSYRGLRIGICGEAVYDGDRLSGLRNYSSLAVRIPHTTLSGSEPLLKELESSKPGSILICSPPGVGKTSLLRELIRRTSRQGQRVAVIDERNELSASQSGNMQFDLGPSCDVIVGVRKAQAAMMLLRGMNPEVIAMDEITREEDLCTVEQITGCGVRIFATVHGTNAQDMIKRPLYKKLLEAGIFDTLVTIRCRSGSRVYGGQALS